MESHCANLSLLSRLCGSTVAPPPPRDPKKKIRSYYPKPVLQYVNIVLCMFKIDCRKDDPDIHQKLLCEKCYSVLNKWRNADPKDVPDRKGTAESYFPHSDTCDVCFPPTNGPVKRPHERVVGLTLSKVKKYVLAKKAHLSEESSSESLQLVFLVLNKNRPQPLEVTIAADGKWSLEVVGRQLNGENCSLFSNSPSLLDDNNFAVFIDHVLKANVCPGNDDFPDIVAKKLDITSRNGTIVSPDGTVRTYVESSNFIRNDSSYLNTLRDAGCEVLVSSDRCNKCKAYRSSLFAMRSQSSSKTHVNCNDR